MYQTHHPNPVPFYCNRLNYDPFFIHSISNNTQEMTEEVAPLKTVYRLVFHIIYEINIENTN